MIIQTKASVLYLLLFIIALFQLTPALARSDDLIQREIKAQIVESAKLRGTDIEVHVQERLVVLTGQVRLYEQQLIAARIAWTTMGVFEVDNEIRVVPEAAWTDAAIERKIWEIVNADERFRAAVAEVAVNNGEVFLKGKFLDFRIPSALKHRVAKIEGVVNIKLDAAIVTRAYGAGMMWGVNSMMKAYKPYPLYSAYYIRLYC